MTYTQIAEEGVKSAAEGRLELWGNLSLADPVFLVLVPLGILAVWWGRTRRGREAGRIPTLPGHTSPGAGPGSASVRTIRQRLAWTVPVLEVCALTLIAVALARPLRGSVEFSSVSEGVDIALVIDRSSSMEHKDLSPNKTRLDVVKEVVGDFAVRRMTDREGNADNIAIVTFAAYPQLLCPFTLDVDAVTGFMGDIKPVGNRYEDGTGVGIALAKAVAVLRETDSESKIIVLLTDGENNIDEIAPLEAAELAAEEGIKVYTVFAGRFVYTYDLLGSLRPTERELDTRELETIAKMTGARFFRARDRESLENVYTEIERLERTEREEKRFSETYDLYPSVLAAALAAYFAAWLCGATLLRRLP